MDIFKQLAVLSEGEVGVKANLGGQRCLHSAAPLRAGGPGTGLGSTSPVSRRSLR
jgi:hypothetical protein